MTISFDANCDSRRDEPELSLSNAELLVRTSEYRGSGGSGAERIEREKENARVSRERQYS